MRHSAGAGHNSGVSLREVSSRHSSPRLTPSSTNGRLTPYEFPDQAGGVRSAHRSLATSPAQPPLVPDDAVTAASPPVEPKRKKKDKEKKEKKAKPQNALFMLASTMGGGGGGATAAAALHVVDLRALDTSPCPSRGSRSPLRSGPSHRRSSRVEDVPPTQILDFLFLGSVKDAQDAGFLAKNKIRYIINVSQEEYWSVDTKVQIFTFKVDDTATADIASLFQPTRDLINSIRARYYRHASTESARRPAVLVHCQKGRSRSATIVLAYLIYTNGWSVAEAMKYVGTRRPCAEPNIGFMEELRKLQESLSAEERTRRYSELCWFMRNLDAETTQAQVRDLFEKRIGMVRHVVMHVVAAAASGGDGGGSPGGDSGATQAGPLSPTAEDAAAVEPLMPLGVGPGGATHGDAAAGAGAGPGGLPVKVHHDAAAPIAGPPRPSGVERTLLCFVFFVCREDVLQGIKSGQFKLMLRLMHPAAGKLIKCATGPKLRKMMTEHQSMSNSFVQDMSSFSDHVATAPEPAEAAAEASADATMATDRRPGAGESQAVAT